MWDQSSHIENNFTPAVVSQVLGFVFLAVLNVVFGNHQNALANFSIVLVIILATKFYTFPKRLRGLLELLLLVLVVTFINTVWLSHEPSSPRTASDTLVYGSYALVHLMMFVVNADYVLKVLNGAFNGKPKMELPRVEKSKESHFWEGDNEIIEDEAGNLYVYIDDLPIELTPVQTQLYWEHVRKTEMSE